MDIYLTYPSPTLDHTGTISNPIPKERHGSGTVFTTPDYFVIGWVPPTANYEMKTNL